MERYTTSWCSRGFIGLLLAGALVAPAGCMAKEADAPVDPAPAEPTTDRAARDASPEANAERTPTPDATSADGDDDMLAGPMPAADDADVEMFLNFISIELDAETMRAIDDPACVLHELARIDRARDRTDDDLPTAVYANFDNTYLELKVDDGDARANEAAVVFSVDRAAEYAAINWALKGAEPDRPLTDLRSMEGGEQPIKWYYHLRLASEAEREAEQSTLEAYVMQYHVEAFMALRIPPREDRRLTRFAYLNAGIEEIGSWGAMDIIGAIVTASDAEAARLDRLMYAGGYVEAELANGARYDGPGFRLDVLRDDAGVAPSVAHVVLRMRTPPPSNEVHHIGSTTLRVGTDGIAVWSFTAPAG